MRSLSPVLLSSFSLQYPISTFHAPRVQRSTSRSIDRSTRECASCNPSSHAECTPQLSFADHYQGVPWPRDAASCSDALVYRSWPAPQGRVNDICWQKTAQPLPHLPPTRSALCSHATPRPRHLLLHSLLASRTGHSSEDQRSPPHHIAPGVSAPLPPGNTLELFVLRFSIPCLLAQTRSTLYTLKPPPPTI